MQKWHNRIIRQQWGWENDANEDFNGTPKSFKRQSSP